MFVWVHVCAPVHACVYLHTWRLEDNVDCCYLGTVHTIFETCSLIVLGPTMQYGLVGQGAPAPSFSSSSAQELEKYAMTLGFFYSLVLFFIHENESQAFVLEH